MALKQNLHWQSLTYLPVTAFALTTLGNSAQIILVSHCFTSQPRHAVVAGIGRGILKNGPICNFNHCLPMFLERKASSLA
jgi:hypothetical protein